MSSEKPRYTITMEAELLRRIDEYRFEHRFANRTQATLELIRLGMEAAERKEKGE